MASEYNDEDVLVCGVGPECIAAGAGNCACDMALLLLTGWGLRENMAVKSISVASVNELRGRFSSGAMEPGEMERIVRLAARLVVRLLLLTESDLLAGTWSVPLSTSSRHWQREPSVQFPHPTFTLFNASSAQAQGPVGSQFPQPVGACSISSGGLIIWEMEKECVVAGRWVASGVLLVRLDVLALPS